MVQNGGVTVPGIGIFQLEITVVPDFIPENFGRKIWDRFPFILAQKDLYFFSQNKFFINECFLPTDYAKTLNKCNKKVLRNLMVSVLQHAKVSEVRAK